MIEKVRGPYQNKRTQRWCIRWKEGEQTKSYEHLRRDEVERRRLELLGEKVTVPELPPYDNSYQWWSESIGMIASTAIKAAQLGDHEAAERVRVLSTTLENLRKTHGPWRELQEAAALIKDILDYLHNTGHRDMIEHAAQQLESRGIASALCLDKGRIETLYHTSDSFPN